MLLDFDIPKSDHGVEKQRLTTNIVTSQSFIEYASQKVEKELANENPYVYTHNESEEVTEIQDSGQVKRSTIIEKLIQMRQNLFHNLYGIGELQRLFLKTSITNYFTYDNMAQCDNGSVENNLVKRKHK